MNTVYLTFKFLHIIGAIVWLGGMVAVSVLSGLIARESNVAVLATMTRLNALFGTRVVGPSAGLTLIAGFVMVAVGRLGGPLWVIWGFFAILASLVLGATVMRVTGNRLSARLSAAASGDAKPADTKPADTKPADTELRGLQRRMALWGIINLLILFSAEWAMVFKPTF